MSRVLHSFPQRCCRNGVVSCRQFCKKQRTVGNRFKNPFAFIVLNQNVGAAKIIPVLQREPKLQIVCVAQARALLPSSGPKPPLTYEIPW